MLILCEFLLYDYSELYNYSIKFMERWLYKGYNIEEWS